jgi:aspartyl-tRNA(Asn)/glutamyl-tRNA(Gln) amidotransferase subunit C
MISKEEVKHIAKLARLELTEKEIEKMQKDLSAILDYFNLLKKAPAPAEASAGKAEKINSNLRKDEVISSYNIRDEIIAQAPDKKDDYIKVKSIL